jgi:cytidylate kinase
MNKNEKYVITINRELGSGGRTVGRKLAEKLGVAFYDKALIKALQEKFHLTVNEIERLKGEKKDLWSEIKCIMQIGPGMSANYYLPQKGSGADLLDTKEIFQAETLILQDIAAEESCVVAGRSGFYVFREHPNHLSILIQASMPFRLERVMRKQGLTEEQARKIIDKVDNMRENYVKEYTKTSRYDTRNYDLVISADGKSEDEIVDIIMHFIG